MTSHLLVPQILVRIKATQVNDSVGASWCRPAADERSQPGLDPPPASGLTSKAVFYDKHRAGRGLRTRAEGGASGSYHRGEETRATDWGLSAPSPPEKDLHHRAAAKKSFLVKSRLILYLTSRAIASNILLRARRRLQKEPMERRHR